MQQSPAGETASSADLRRRPRRGARIGAAVLFSLPFALQDFAIAAAGVGFVPRAVAALTTLAVLALLRALVRRAKSRVLASAFGLLLGALFVLEIYTARYYGIHVDRQLAASAMFNARDVLPVVVRSIPVFVPLALLAALFFHATTRWPRASGPARPLGIGLTFVIVIAIACVAPAPRSIVADFTLALGAIGEKPSQARSSAAKVPEIVSRRGELPNVLVVLTESLRARSYCDGSPCETAPKTSLRFGDRTTLGGMRSIASYTAVSFAALTSGQPQTGDLDALGRMPTIFDLLAHVHGSNATRVHVAYFSAQSRSIFVRDDLDRPMDASVTLETLVGTRVDDEDDFVDRGVDRLIVTEAKERLGKLPEPYFAFLHLAGTHAPYFVDPTNAPFQPYVRYAAWSQLPALENAYRNAMVAQDEALDRFFAAFEEAQHGKPFAIVFTSDHGEAFGEHGAIHHGQNLYEEQLHVPAWIYASPGAIDPAARTALSTWTKQTTSHLDVVPTLLDLYGALDDPALASIRANLPGRSLLRSPVPLSSPIVLTNCTAQFKCPVTTFGLLGESREITAQPWDASWRCIDLGSGAAGQSADPECTALARASTAIFPRLPNGAPNR